MKKKNKLVIITLIIIFIVTSLLILLSKPARADKTNKNQTNWEINPKKVDQLIRVSLKKQRLYFFENGKLIHTFLCSGSSGPIKPRNVHPKKPHDHAGIFTIDSKERNHRSKLFHVDMPYALHFWSGHYIHQSNIVSQLGQPASHGCVRLRHKNAKWLYSQIKIGTKVEIR